MRTRGPMPALRSSPAPSLEPLLTHGGGGGNGGGERGGEGDGGGAGGLNNIGLPVQAGSDAVAAKVPVFSCHPQP